MCGYFRACDVRTNGSYKILYIVRWHFAEICYDIDPQPKYNETFWLFNRYANVWAAPTYYRVFVPNPCKSLKKDRKRNVYFNSHLPMRLIGSKEINLYTFLGTSYFVPFNDKGIILYKRKEALFSTMTLWLSRSCRLEHFYLFLRVVLHSFMGSVSSKM